MCSTQCAAKKTTKCNSGVTWIPPRSQMSEQCCWHFTLQQVQETILNSLVDVTEPTGQGSEKQEGKQKQPTDTEARSMQRVECWETDWRGVKLTSHLLRRAFTLELENVASSQAGEQEANVRRVWVYSSLGFCCNVACSLVAMSLHASVTATYLLSPGLRCANVIMEDTH